MRHFSSILVSLIALSACTQPPAAVEMRGALDYSREGNGSQMASSTSTSQGYAPKYVGASPVYNSSRAQYDQAAANAPTESAAPVNSISMNDLQPAAGKAEPVKETTVAKAEPAKGHYLTLPAKNQPAVKAEATPKAEPKLVELKKAPAPAKEAKADEAVPVNAWTKKPRNAASFKTSKAGYIWPVSSHNVTTSFGSSGKSKDNEGINIASSEGEPVWAAADGEVVYSDAKMKGYGNMVIVKHAGGKSTTYAHLSRSSVDKYDRIKQGDIIGYVGSTGSVKTPQLFFSMRDGTQAIDPQKYLDRKVAGL